ncbi:MAG: ribonuclease P protein component [Verrucomicrobiota bacterium]
MTATPNLRPHRLPRKKILRGRNAFQLLKAEGHRKAGKLLVCNFLEISGHDQVAFILSKRCGPAVVRNRIRRRLKEAFRHCRQDILSDRVVVWIARAPAAAATYAELEAEMHELLTKSKLWRAKDGF